MFEINNICIISILVLVIIFFVIVLMYCNKKQEKFTSDCPLAKPQRNINGVYLQCKLCGCAKCSLNDEKISLTGYCDTCMKGFVGDKQGKTCTPCQKNCAKAITNCAECETDESKCVTGCKTCSRGYIMCFIIKLFLKSDQCFFKIHP